MARVVPDDAPEVVGKVGVVAKVGADVLQVDGVDDVLQGVNSIETILASVLA